MFLIDYLSFTIRRDGLEFEDVLSILKISEYVHDFIDLGQKRGYCHCYKLGNINISTPFNDSDRGIYIDMSGQGCREYEDNFNTLTYKFDWSILFKALIKCVDVGCYVNITRLDLAFDDFDGRLKLPKIYRKLLKGEFVSRYKTFSKITSNEKHSKHSQLGCTYYVGSTKSDCFCKFYDKKAEMLEKHKQDECITQKVELMPHWVRFEITFKGVNAMTVCNLISFGLIDDISSHINGCFRFIEPKVTRSERCPISKWWAEFMESVDYNRIRNVISTLEGYEPSMAWFHHAVVPTAYALMQTFPNKLAFVRYILKNAPARISSKHKLIINKGTKGLKLSNRTQWQENSVRFKERAEKLNEKKCNEMHEMYLSQLL